MSTTGNGQVDAQVNRDGQSMIRYTLRYRKLERKVQQSHIHFGQEGVNGGIVVFLCSNLGNGPAGTPPCPDPPATVTGTVTGARRHGGRHARRRDGPGHRARASSTSWCARCARA